MQIETDVALAPLTTMAVGGSARFFARAQSEADIQLALEWARARRLPLRILGGGSNVVAPDGGVAGLVLSIQNQGLHFEMGAERGRVIAAAGERWDDVVRGCIERELAGLECLSGIPGLVGATPIQNVGAYGQEVKDCIVSVRAFDREGWRFVELDASACEFSYRDSRFKSREPERFVISAVTFELARSGIATLRYPELVRALGGSAGTLRAAREAVLGLRRAKSMLLDPADPNRRSCGSFFVNPLVAPELAEAVRARFPQHEMPRFPQPNGAVKLSAAWLIERAGFQKGARSGAVGLSTRHALALVCHDGASAEQLTQFAAQVQKTVLERTGVELSPEPALW